MGHSCSWQTVFGSSGNCVLAVAPEASLLSSLDTTGQKRPGRNGKAVQSTAPQSGWRRAEQAIPGQVGGSVWHPLEGEIAGQWIAVIALGHSPSAARRDALECGALRRFPLGIPLYSSLYLRC
jgi:hypothetical protein